MSIRSKPAELISSILNLQTSWVAAVLIGFTTGGVFVALERALSLMVASPLVRKLAGRLRPRAVAVVPEAVAESEVSSLSRRLLVARVLFRASRGRRPVRPGALTCGGAACPSRLLPPRMPAPCASAWLAAAAGVHRAETRTDRRFSSAPRPTSALAN